MKIAALGQNHPIQRNQLFANNYHDKWSEKTTVEKIKLISKVACAILLSLALFWINPALFFISFVAGLAFNRVIQNGVDKIKVFLSHYKWPVLVGCAVMAFMVLPVFLATGSVLWSAYMGSILSQRAQNVHPNKERYAAPAA